MANIIEEAKGLEALMAAMEQMDKEVTVKPQVCDMDTGECLSCGS